MSEKSESLLYNIIQIMPVTGDWVAVFADDEPNKAPDTSPLIGWALCEEKWEGAPDEVMHIVSGLVVTDEGTVDLCVEYLNFKEYRQVQNE